MMPDVCPSAGCFHRNPLEMYGMEVLAAWGVSLPAPSPPTPLALLNTTVILINKHLHLCILLCEPGRVLRQAVRLKTRAPALRARPLFYHFRLNGDRHF